MTKISGIKKFIIVLSIGAIVLAVVAFCGVSYAWWQGDDLSEATASMRTGDWNESGGDYDGEIHGKNGYGIVPIQGKITVSEDSVQLPDDQFTSCYFVFTVGPDSKFKVFYDKREVGKGISNMDIAYADVTWDASTETYTYNGPYESTLYCTFNISDPNYMFIAMGYAG